MSTRHLPLTLTRLIQVVTWTENALLIGMLALMVVLAAAQILLRNFFDVSIAGADQLVRLLVLWVALLGAVAASRDGKHIHIDVGVRWLPGRARAVAMALTDVFASSVCLVLAWQALRFMQSARESGELAFGDVPVWIAELILPLGFTLIALRYVLRGVYHVRQALGREALS